MVNIIDKRQGSKNKSSSNRKRFLDRYKETLKKQVNDMASKKGLKKIGEKNKVKIKPKSIDEPMFRKEQGSGDNTRVLPGNKQFKKGDQVAKPPKGKGQGHKSGNSTEQTEEEFTFTLTKEEFLDIYFSDMELPNYVKEHSLKDCKMKLKRAGYSKYGIPARIDLKKTFEQSMARRISTKAQGKKPRFLDDVDIRYRQFAPKPIPVKQAVMFCIMDVSGSMTEHKKEMAKKFYLLLYLFLQKEYEAVELVFIRHTHEAQEVDEKTFFYDRIMGGTIVSEALLLMKKISEARFPSEEWNIYICQCSDGDNWPDDMPQTIKILTEDVLPLCQYYAYVQTMNLNERMDRSGLFPVMKELSETIAHLNTGLLYEDKDVYPVLQDLFKEQK